MKRLKVLFCAALLVYGVSGTAGAAPIDVFLSGVTQASGWSDVEQAPFGNLCWAASASDMLAYSGWNGGLTSAGAIFGVFSSDWSNVVGNPYYGVNWWFTGTNGQQGVAGWAQVTTPMAGNYSASLFSANFGFADGPSPSNALSPANVASYIQGDVTGQRVFTMLLGDSSGGIHYLTGWGYEMDGGVVTGVWFTDSFDGVSSLKFSPLICSATNCQLDVYSGLYIIEMESLGFNSGGVQPNPGSGDGTGTVPEPSSLLLLGTGLVGAVVAVRRKRHQ